MRSAMMGVVTLTVVVAIVVGVTAVVATVVVVTTVEGVSIMVRTGAVLLARHVVVCDDRSDQVWMNCP